MTTDSKTKLVFVVGWDGPNDPLKPHNWSTPRRVLATMMVSWIAFSVTATSSIDAAVTKQTSEAYHVGLAAGSLTTGCYLLGFAVGSLFAGSFSETLGRNIVYMGSMAVYLLFIMACGLAPNYGAKIALRFLTGFFGTTPLTCAGGTVADLWNALEATFGFPILAISGFGGPLLGPVIGAYIGNGKVSLRWTEWSMLILGALVLILVLCFQPETYAPLLLKWKAHHFRQLTGDERYQAEIEITDHSLLSRLKTSSYRPFLFVRTEPLVIVIALYLSIVYIVLFTFFGGYDSIFTETYSISEGLTNILWVAMLVGVLCALPLVPLVYSWTKKEYEIAKANNTVIRPEIRLWFVMMGGSFAIPISLLWMGWTSYPYISIWSPITASVVFGYGVMTIFTSAYMYLIDVYQIYAASALTFTVFSRYMAAGVMTVVGVPMYNNLGVHYTLTILACISFVMAPVPFLLYRYGHKVRQLSRQAQSKN